MIKINLLKPGVMVYDNPEPGGIIDIERLESTRKIKPCLLEVVWDKEDYESKIALIEALKVAGMRGSRAGKKLREGNK